LQFEGVSDLIRCRLKLSDVNTVYEVICQHFDRSKKAGPLTLKDLTEMGCRVTGHTGEAKLKVCCRWLGRFSQRIWTVMGVTMLWLFVDWLCRCCDSCKSST
jgi:saccharopine dehydrogenase-like NADP-dependent oxidoreductase